jgi:hypothetical protein
MSAGPKRGQPRHVGRMTRRAPRESHPQATQGPELETSAQGITGAPWRARPARDQEQGRRAQRTEGGRGSSIHGDPAGKREVGVGCPRQGHGTEVEDNTSSGAEKMTEV